MYGKINPNLISGRADSDALIYEILQNILVQTGADRTYIFEFDWVKRTHSCNYETLKDQTSSYEHQLKGIPIDETPWWRDQLLNQDTIIVNDTTQMPEQASIEQQILLMQSIKSLIVAPLVSKGHVWGYVGIDVVDKLHIWSENDMAWFSSIANIISICLELKRSESMERKAKEQTQKLYKNMPIGLLRIQLIYDQNNVVVDYIYLAVNPSFCSMRDCLEEDIINKRNSEIGEGISAGYQNELGRVIKSKETFSNMHFDAKTGKYFQYTLFSTDDDEVTILLQDYTKAMVASKALRNSEETMQNIYKNIPVGIEIYDKDGSLIDVNEREQELFGFENKESIIGINLFENPLLPPSELKKLKAGEQVRFEFIYDFDTVKSANYYHTNRNSKRDIIVKGTPIFDVNNNIENYLLIVIDNTDIIYTHNKLTHFESLFNSIARISELGIFQWNALPNMFMGTNQWFMNFCLPTIEIDNIMDSFKFVHEEDRLRLEENLNAISAGEILYFKDEIRVKDGNNWKWLRCNFKGENIDPSIGAQQIIGLNIDITELKNTELKLIEAKSKAEESDRLKSAFVANMSHEIRTPLNAILGFSELLMDTNDTNEKSQYISIIRQNNDLLLQLISDILDISKIESGIIETLTETVDIDALCKEIVVSMAIKTNYNVVLSFDNRNKNCIITSDKNRLKQIISNLIGNAIKFTPSGSITIGYIIENEFIKFYIKDTGLGISKDKIDSIFTRFVKLNSFIHGTGLGLPICKSLINKLGGDIWVESQLGEGSCFWFTLPYDKADDSMQVEIEASTCIDHDTVQYINSNGKPSVLIAEDTDSNYLLISTILKKDYTLTRATNGIEAIKIFEQIQPDVVFMDMKMPMMGGIQATQEIRKFNTTTPIIALTAFAFDSDKQNALNAGCCEFLTKPLNQRQLVEVLQRVLYGKKS